MANDEEPNITLVNAPIRVVAVDDHKVVRLGLRELFSKHPEFELVAEGSTPVSALELTKAHEPDVVLFDLMFDKAPAYDFITALATQAPDSPVLVHSGLVEAEAVVHSLRAGARGFVFKGDEDVTLLDALRVVARGEVFLGIDRKTYAATAERLGLAVGEALSKLYECLSAREREVFAHWRAGLSIAETATVLGIKSSTVEKHRTNIRRRLGLSESEFGPLVKPR